MNIIGIIAEYNPFHNGHAYQIACAKKQFGADAVVVVMSGDFTQRGIPAVFHKESRANMALSCGADLVIELPVLASTASAEGFALGAVRALDSLGVVNQLLFGCETDQIELFYRSASLLGDESEDFRFRLRSHIRSGNSYPQARAAAFPKEIPSGFLDTPNNILGVEYVKALLRLSSPMVPVCLRRRGSQHHDQSPSGNFLSAGALRQKIENLPKSTESFSALHPYLPEGAYEICHQEWAEGKCVFADDFSLLLHDRLYETNDFTVYADCSESLSAKICRLRDRYVSFSQFCQLLKSKDLTYTRVSRVLCHILLRVYRKDFQRFMSLPRTPYIRILGFNRQGASILSEIKNAGKQRTVPLFVSPKEGERLLSSEQLPFLAADIAAADRYRMVLTAKTGRAYPSEYTRKFEPFPEKK